MLLTGAAGGIGRVMTQALLADGHRVAAVDRDAAALERLQALAAANGPAACASIADLSQEAACLEAVAAARERFGTVEAVINNAGIGMSAIRPDAEARHPGIEELTPETLDRFFAIFVRAPAILTRAALPMMQAARLRPDRQQHHELSDDAARAALWRRQGRARIDVGGVGGGARRAARSPSTCWCRAGRPTRR